MRAAARLGIATQPRNAPGSTALWHSGPPPSGGWWPASFRGQNTDLVRYWHAQRKAWSVPAHPRMSAKVAGMCAAAMAGKKTGDLVLWRDRPANWGAK